MNSNLKGALMCFLEDETVASSMAETLTLASKGLISYEEVSEQCGENAEDVVLVALQWRLLLPVRAIRCMEWDDRLLVIDPGETYAMPNVVKWLVDHANDTGEWSPDHALTMLFDTMGDPFYRHIPQLVERLITRAQNHRISAAKIIECCRDVGLSDRVDSLIAELKGSGVMSPRLGPLADVVNARGGPIYELNPCLAHKTS